jgi:SagB-type dehydrogenase family enzyme
MRKWILILFILALSALALIGAKVFFLKETVRPDAAAINFELVPLPPPKLSSNFSIEEALQARRSVREYSGEELTLTEIAQLLWSAQGITHEGGLRTAPSAGARYPLELYLLSTRVQDLEAGIYKYRPKENALMAVAAGDWATDLVKAAVGQSAVSDAAAVFIITGVFERTTERYGDRGVRYVYLEAGCAAQNLALQAEALQLGSVFIGAFHEDDVKRILQLPDEEEPLAIIPVGRK